METKANAFLQTRKTKMAGYTPDKLIKAIEDYLSGPSYLVGPERKVNLNKILQAVKDFKCQLEKK